MTGARIERRTLLGAALLTGVAGLTGCADRPPDLPRRDLVPADGGGGVNPTPTITPNPTPTPTGTPTPADWKALAESLSGKLLRPGDAGYPVAHQLFDPMYDSVMPTAVVECANTADVVKSLEFRARFGLAVVGKSGGHSYVGASTTQGGMVISVRPISGISVSGDTARVGAGAPLSDVYSRLAAKGRVIPAGSCPSVGVAGLALGGGLGLANRIYGLTCDVITQVEVVTPDGVVRTASPGKEPKLFFACQGGGGGTLGVVTAFT
ncbi:MAG TPA: FAD-dependent oxidoreductase, partial [Actinopolymorphaceae bacterium]|nr:FAD-dependent oxidoreductase [Actinopolymorphaceae bacterium]